MTSEQKLISAVKHRLRSAGVRAHTLDLGWVIEVIDPSIDVRRKVGTALIAAGLTHPFDLWKLFTYSEEDFRYLVDGTLHTVRHKVDAQGMSIVELAWGDAIVRIPEYDSELLINGVRSIKIPAVEMLNKDGKPILPYRDGTSFRWLETGGSGPEYTVKAVKRNGTLENGEARLEIEIA